MWWKILIGVVIFIAIAVTLGFTLTNKYAKLGTQFMTFLDEGKTKDAYAMLHPEMYTTMSFEDFAKNFKFTSKLKDVTWNSRTYENGLAEIQGSILFEDGDKFSTYMAFVKENGDWKVAEINIEPITDR